MLVLTIILVFTRYLTINLEFNLNLLNSTAYLIISESGLNISSVHLYQFYISSDLFTLIINLIVFGLMILSIVLILYLILHNRRKNQRIEKAREHQEYLINSRKPISLAETDELFQSTQGVSLSFIQKLQKEQKISGVLLGKEIFIPNVFMDEISHRIGYGLFLTKIKYDLEDLKIKLINKDAKISDLAKYFQVSPQIIETSINYLIHSGKLIGYIKEEDKTFYLLNGFGLKVLLNNIEILDLENFWEHIELFELWGRRVLKFFNENGKIPSEDDAIMLGMTAEYYTPAIKYFSMELDKAILPMLENDELEYYDKLLNHVIQYVNESKLEFDLNGLVIGANLGILDAKILIKYVIERTSQELKIQWPLPGRELKKFDEMVSKIFNSIKDFSGKDGEINYLNLISHLKITIEELNLANQYIRKMVEEPLKLNFTYLGNSELNELDDIATRMIRSVKDITSVNLTDLISDLNIGLYTARKVVAYREWILHNYQIENLDYMSNMDIKRINTQFTEILKKIIKEKKELSLKVLIFDHDMKLRDALQALSFYKLVLEKDFEFKYMFKSDRIMIQENSAIVREYIEKLKTKKVKLDDLLIQFDLKLLDLWNIILYLQQEEQLDFQVIPKEVTINKDKTELIYDLISF